MPIDIIEPGAQYELELPKKPCVGDTIVVRDPHTKQSIWVVRVKEVQVDGGCVVERINGPADSLFDADAPPPPPSEF